MNFIGAGTSLSREPHSFVQLFFVSHSISYLLLNSARSRMEWMGSRLRFINHYGFETASLAQFLKDGQKSVTSLVLQAIMRILTRVGCGK